MLLDLPSLPEIQAHNARALSSGAEYALRMAPMPGMARVGSTSGDREREARRYAAEMRTAFAYSKFQDKVMRAKARAKGRATQRAAERR